MSDTLVKVEGVSKKFCRSLKRSLWYGLLDLGNELVGRSHGGNGEIRPDEFWAVKNVSFELKRGECLGLIGRNGAGKTTLLRMLNGLIKPDQGRIMLRGKVGALIALGSGFNPILTGRENIYVNASVLGLTKRETDDKIEEIIDFAEIEQFIDAPVQCYSSGMQVRLGFAVATALQPDILLLDEVLAVGDASFRAKCFSRVGRLLKNASVIFVSHSDAQIRRLCDCAIHMSSGKMQFYGDVDRALHSYSSVIFDGSYKQTKIEAEWIRGDGVVSVNASIENVTIKWSDCVSINIELESKYEFTLSKAYIQLYRNDESVANAESIWFGDEGPQIRKGNNIISSKIGPLYLISGSYVISVALFTENGKITVAHTLNLGSVLVEGSVGVGPTTLVPCSWYVK